MYLTVKVITNDKKEQALLLLTGEQIQDIWFNLVVCITKRINVNVYSDSSEALDKYLFSLKSYFYEWHILRSVQHLQLYKL